METLSLRQAVLKRYRSVREFCRSSTLAPFDTLRDIIKNGRIPREPLRTEIERHFAEQGISVLWPAAQADDVVANSPAPTLAHPVDQMLGQTLKEVRSQVKTYLAEAGNDGLTVHQIAEDVLTYSHLLDTLAARGQLNATTYAVAKERALRLQVALGNSRARTSELRIRRRTLARST